CQEDPDPAAWAPVPDDEADRQTEEQKGEVDEFVVLDGLRLADRVEGERHSGEERRSRQPHEQPDGSHADSPTSAASAATVRSLLEMNPSACSVRASVPRSDALLLEVRTTSGRSCRAASAFATSKPVISGSSTSSKTTSGRRVPTAAIADAPSSASRTTR